LPPSIGSPAAASGLPHPIGSSVATSATAPAVASDGPAPAPGAGVSPFDELAGTLGVSAPASDASADDGARLRPAPAIRDIRARPASLWRRAGALLLDTAIVLGVLTLYLTLATLLVHPATVRGPHLDGLDGLMARLHVLNGVLLPVAVLGILLAVVYSTVFAFLWGGRTPGRWLFGIRLVDRRGLAPAPGHAVARALLAVVSFALCLAGFWLSLFDRRGQTLHDKLARTFVVRPG
jgi:uncharacterized RDD family membrane protein YckC